MPDRVLGLGLGLGPRPGPGQVLRRPTITTTTVKERQRERERDSDAGTQGDRETCRSAHLPVDNFTAVAWAAYASGSDLLFSFDELNLQTQFPLDSSTNAALGT